MKQHFKWALIVLSFCLFLLVSAIGQTVAFLFPSRRWHLMSRLTYILMGELLKILGFRIKVEGNVAYLKEHGNLIISRHVSYTDGLILGGLTPAVLVSKKDVKKWPLFGQVVAISGTIFVDRMNNKDFSYLDQMTELLKSKVTVVVFPEGTSTNGAVVKPFQSVFFKAPIEAGASILPVTISYLKIDGAEITAANRGDIVWYGQVGFFNHLWNLLQFNRIDVTVTVHDKIEVKDFSDNSNGRKNLNQRCQQMIVEKAGLHDFIAVGSVFENGVSASARGPAN